MSEPTYRRDEQLIKAANDKALQLEREIRASDATADQKTGMLHTLSKLTMFASDAWRKQRPMNTAALDRLEEGRSFGQERRGR